MDNLKEIICDNIYQTLSVDKNVRQNAEQQLNMLETNDGKLIVYFCYDLQSFMPFLFNFRLWSSFDGD